MPRWRSLQARGERGLELTLATTRLHAVGSFVEVEVPLRAAPQSVRGTVVRAQATAAGWELSIAVPASDAGRAALLARICELEHCLHLTDPAVRRAAGERRLREWRQIRARISRLPALYAALVHSLPSTDTADCVDGR